MPLPENNSGISPVFYWEDERLQFMTAGRMLIRIISAISWAVLVAASLIFLVLPDSEAMRWLGVFLFLFLGRRWFKRTKGDVALNDLPKEGRINLAHSLTTRAYGILEKSYDRSSLIHSDALLELAHILCGEKEIKIALTRLDVSHNEFVQKLEELARESASLPEKDKISNKEVLSRVVEAAAIEALEGGRLFVGVIDLAAGISRINDNYMTRLLAAFSLKSEDWIQSLLFSISLSSVYRKPKMVAGISLDFHRRVPHRIVNRAWTSKPTNVLDQFSTDLTDLARAGGMGFLLGHEIEYGRLVEALSRPVNPNALLVGDVGIGKQTIVDHLAFCLTRDDVPSQLFDRRLVSLNLPALIAGVDTAQAQQRIQEVVSEIMESGNIILCIPEIHNLVRTSGSGYLSVADALLPILKSDSFPVIGTTYPREFRELVEPRSDFVGEFELIQVQEISQDEAEKFLVYESLILEQGKKIVVSFAAIRTAVQLASRYPRGKFLPTSASEILKEALVRAERTQSQKVGQDDVISVMEEKVNVPLHQAAETESKKLLNLEAIIHESLIDQEDAVRSVAEVLREYRSGLSRKGGPIASFLFVGPTGVGKTELAKIIAKILFNSEKAMVRFDMTEYQDKESIHRLIGSSDGLTEGVLTEAIRQKPFSLVLLDEFEKSFPDIRDLFLQVLDDGRLTDSLGRTVDFENSLIIATSNAHSEVILEKLSEGKSIPEIAEEFKTKLADVYKPELLNRFTKIIVFKSLSQEDTTKVAVNNLNALVKLVAEQNIELKLDASLVAEVARKGYDPMFGARPLRRVIDELVRAPLAEAILRREIGAGSSVLAIWKDNKVVFQPENSGIGKAEPSVQSVEEKSNIS